MQLTLSIGGQDRRLDVDALVVAGWTGRDEAAVQHHIDELAAIGVPRPSATPLYYRVASSLLTQGETIQVVGDQTSGEAGPVLIDTGRGVFLTLGSDHTDRSLEAHSVALSKQACAKVLARQAWRLEDVADRLDTLRLRSWTANEGGGWTPYQEGTLAAIRPLGGILAAARERTPGGTLAILCGTIPTQGGLRPAQAFRCELVDPKRNDSISLTYAVRTLPIIT